MNLPNKLTLMRVLLIPIIVVLFYINPLHQDVIFFEINYANFLIVIIFILASFTDFLDGYIARKNNQVTTFGKFADPLADKLLVMSALVILMVQNKISAWIVIVILSREFIVTGIRLVASEQQKVIAASNLGKSKTMLTMLAIIVLFFNNFTIKPFFDLWTIGDILMFIALAMTIISGIDYFWKNRKIIFESI